VLCPADVEIDRHPGPLHLGGDEPLRVRRIEESQVIPARPRPLRHRVGLAAVALAVPLHEQPLGPRAGKRGIGRVTRLVVGELGERHRQITLVHGADHPRGIAGGVELVEDRKRLAPKPLPAEEPVAEFVVDGGTAEACRGQIGRHLRDELPCAEASVGAGVHAAAVAHEEFTGHDGAFQGLDDRDDIQPEGLRELKVAVVVGRHGHDRAGAVGREHVVGHPHRHGLASERMDHR